MSTGTSTSPSSKKEMELALYYHLHSLLMLEGQLIQYQLDQLEQLNRATPAFAFEEEAELNEINGDGCCIINGENLHSNATGGVHKGVHDYGKEDPVMLLLPAPPSRSGSPSLVDLNIKISSASSFSCPASSIESKADRRVRFAFDNI